MCLRLQTKSIGPHGTYVRWYNTREAPNKDRGQEVSGPNNYLSSMYKQFIYMEEILIENNISTEKDTIDVLWIKH